MKCISPIRLKNPTPKGLYQDVPCGKCAACMTNKRNSWSIRLQDELQYSDSGAFITLTYSDEYFFETAVKADNVELAIKMNESVHKSHLQDFMKRFRYHDGSPNIRYFGVGEYGTKSDRPHYHVLLFNIDFQRLAESIEKSWTFGLHHIGEINDASIHYVSGYVVTSQYAPKEHCQKTFALMSRRPGIGTKKLEKMASSWKDSPTSCVTRTGGQKTAMPRFYREKVYDDADKRFLQAQAQEAEEKNYEVWYIKQRRSYANNDLVLKKFTKNKTKI